MNDTSGLTCWTPLAFYDPNTHCWKTSQGTLPLDLTESSPTLPASGSMQNGQLFQRVLWVPHIHEAGCFVWPTPRTRMAKTKCTLRREARRNGLNLEEAVAEADGRTGGYVNPRWIEWLMGFPHGWCEHPFTP